MKQSELRQIIKEEISKNLPLSIKNLKGYQIHNVPIVNKRGLWNVMLIKGEDMYVLQFTNNDDYKILPFEF
jgi:hypothetical protein